MSSLHNYSELVCGKVVFFSRAPYCVLWNGPFAIFVPGKLSHDAMDQGWCSRLGILDPPVIILYYV